MGTAYIHPSRQDKPAVMGEKREFFRGVLTMSQNLRLLLNQLQRENTSLRGRLSALEAITGQSVPDQTVCTCSSMFSPICDYCRARSQEARNAMREVLTEREEMMKKTFKKKRKK